MGRRAEEESAWVWFVGAVYIMHNHLRHASAADLLVARKKSRLREGFFAVLNGEEDKRPKPGVQNRPSRNAGKKKLNPVRAGPAPGPELTPSINSRVRRIVGAGPAVGALCNA